MKKCILVEHPTTWGKWKVPIKHLMQKNNSEKNSKRDIVLVMEPS
jgi:hypothetical protein